MLILEHDAKEILAAHGVATPGGVLVSAGAGHETPPFPPPWFVKAQIPIGGRGKAGGIKRVETDGELMDALAGLMMTHINGHLVRECRIEQAVAAGSEAFLSLAVDPATGGVHVLVSPRGGVDIEDGAHRDAVSSTVSGHNPEAIQAAFRALSDPLDEPARSALMDAGGRLAAIFCQLEATLLEINPLLVMADGSWQAGDARLIVDDNALVRQPELTALIESRARSYPQAAMKLAHGFDYVELDPEGDIALVTTGAGLSMQLIDELAARGCRPFNFCDIRSGNFRGDPARLVKVLSRIASGPHVASVLINFFAGITHLGELSRLLLVALRAAPQMRAPVTLRLVGNGLDEARLIMKVAPDGIDIETDLETAVSKAIAKARGGP